MVCTVGIFNSALHDLVLIKLQAGNYSLSVKTAAGAHIYCGLPQEDACSPFTVRDTYSVGQFSFKSSFFSGMSQHSAAESGGERDSCGYCCIEVRNFLQRDRLSACWLLTRSFEKGRKYDIWVSLP